MISTFEINPPSRNDFRARKTLGLGMALLEISYFSKLEFPTIRLENIH
jgi:hypothetical protein